MEYERRSRQLRVGSELDGVINKCYCDARTKKWQQSTPGPGFSVPLTCTHMPRGHRSGGKSQADVWCSCHVFNSQQVCETSDVCDLRKQRHAFDALKGPNQIHHQLSLVIGSLSPHKSIFPQTFTCAAFTPDTAVPAFSLRCFSSSA